MSHFSEAVRQRVTRVLALSERAVRALSAVAVGASTLLTETLFPEALRGTTLYRVTIGLMQQFLIEQVAGMGRELTEGQPELSDDYARRKMMGTALETAGLLAIGFSPLWVLAIAGDVAGGSKVYLRRLVEHLKENGLVAPETEPTDLVGVLDAVQAAAGQSAGLVDMPPLSREELSALVEDMRASYGQALARTADLMPQLDDIWSGMESLARRDDVPVERVGGLMTVNAVSRWEKGAGLALAAGRAGAELIDEKILDSYRQTLAAAAEQGVDTYVAGHMRPFLQAARSHFDAGRTTWIESKLAGPDTGAE